jgi:hypothetical protein
MSALQFSALAAGDDRLRPDRVHRRASRRRSSSGVVSGEGAEPLGARRFDRRAEPPDHVHGLASETPADSYEWSPLTGTDTRDLD